MNLVQKNKNGKKVQQPKIGMEVRCHWDSRRHRKYWQLLFRLDMKQERIEMRGPAGKEAAPGHWQDQEASLGAAAQLCLCSSALCLDVMY